MGCGVEILKKPTGDAAWAASSAAGLDLCAFVLLAASNAGAGILVFFGGCELALILLAIRAWKKYFEGLIDYRVRELEGGGSETRSLAL